MLHRSIDSATAVCYYDPAAEGVGALSDATVRPSVCLSVCPMPLGQKRCILGIWLL